MKEYVNGSIKADIEKLSKSLYEMIKKHPDGHCLSMGMLPASLMNILEINLKSRIKDEFIDKTYPVGEMFRTDGAKIRREIVHEVSCSILKLATQDGVCKV